MLLGRQLLGAWERATVAPGESREGFPARRGEEEELKHRRPSNFMDNWVLEAWRRTKGWFFSSWHQTWEWTEECAAQCRNRQSFQLYFVLKNQGFWLRADTRVPSVWRGGRQSCSLLGSLSRCLAVACKLSWKRLREVMFELDFLSFLFFCIFGVFLVFLFLFTWGIMWQA